jgi:hypothetical protein
MGRRALFIRWLKMAAVGGGAALLGAVAHHKPGVLGNVGGKKLAMGAGGVVSRLGQILLSPSYINVTNAF